jgi:hypothetical protein
MKTHLLLFLLLIPCKAYFQSDSTFVLQLHIHPAQTQIWVDGQKSMYSQFMVLPKGEHKLTFWHDGYHQYDTTIVVTTAGVAKLVKRLEMKEEYKQYLKSKKQFDNRKLACKVFQGGFIVATVASTGYFYSQAKASMENTNASIEAYNNESSLKQFDNHRNNYSSEKAKFEANNRNIFIAAGIGTIVSTSFWIWRETL